MRLATWSVGLVSPRSTWLSIGATDAAALGEVAQAEVHRLAQRAHARADVDRDFHLVERRHTCVRYHVQLYCLCRELPRTRRARAGGRRDPGRGLDERRPRRPGGRRGCPVRRLPRVRRHVGGLDRRGAAGRRARAAAAGNAGRARRRAPAPSAGACSARPRASAGWPRRRLPRWRLPQRLPRAPPCARSRWDGCRPAATR